MIPRLALLLLPLSWSAMAQPATSPAAPMLTSPDGGSRPVPDPTLLTTLGQEKAIAALRELLDARLKAIEIAGSEQKERLIRTDDRLIVRIDQLPAVMDDKVLHLQKLMEEKFKGVDQQVHGRDTALAAALLAQKTSVTDQQASNAASAAKAENATAKQIDSILTVVAGNQKGADDKIDSVKTLLAAQAKSNDDKIAELRNAMNDLRTQLVASNTALVSRGAGQSDLWGYLIAAAMFLIALVSVTIAIFNVMARHSPRAGQVS